MAGDLKTFWDNPILSNTDLGGDSITSSGTDPNSDGGDEGGNGLTQVCWDNPPVPPMTKAESPNSVSGLPSLPNRFEPPSAPPPPPTLEDRRPGTIDEQ